VPLNRVLYLAIWAVTESVNIHPSRIHILCQRARKCTEYVRQPCILPEIETDALHSQSPSRGSDEYMTTAINFWGPANKVSKVLLASACLSACLNWRTFKRIFTKFGIRKFYYNLLIHSSFGGNQTKTMAIYEGINIGLSKVTNIKLKIIQVYF
jgi:hypothetical protein